MHVSKPLPIVVVALLLAGCDATCGNDIVHVAQAPGRSHKAVVFRRDCGATTGFSTHVSVLPSGEEVVGSGNVLVADGGREDSAWGGPWVETAWRSPTSLVVKHDAKARLFQQIYRAGSVAISYRPVER